MQVRKVGVSNCNKRGRWKGEGDHDDQDGVTTAFRLMLEDDIIVVMVVVASAACVKTKVDVTKKPRSVALFLIMCDEFGIGSPV